jgi:hypothetical protein
MHKKKHAVVSMKISGARVQKHIHLVDKASGLDNITLLNTNEKGSEEVKQWNLMICSKVPKFTNAH